MRRCVYRLLGLAVVGSGLMLGGCAHQAGQKNSQMGGFQNTPACQNNAFLQRYGCSLDRVEQAAESSDPDAMYALGYMYYYGIGTVRDKDTAVVWIQRAAGMNQPLAIKAMEMIYHKSYKRQGRAQMQQKKLSNDSLPQLKTNIKTNQPHQQQFTRKSTPAMPKQMHQAKQLTVAHLTSASAKQNSNWIGATQTADSVTASHAVSVAKGSGKRYTLQIMASHSIAVIKQVLQQYALGNNASYYHTYFQNKNWYVLIYGDYTNVSDAKQAAASLPSGIQQLHPWVKSYRTVQKEILEKRVI